MIFVFLVVLIVALVLANLFVAVLKPKKNNQKGFVNPTYSQDDVSATEVMAGKEIKTEETALVNGSIKSMNQKINLMNTRIMNMERAVTELAKQRISESKQISGKTEKSQGIDEKTKNKIRDLADFRNDAKIRLEAMEKQLEKMNGKPIAEKKKLETFDKKTEERIRSLVYNSGRK